MSDAKPVDSSWALTDEEGGVLSARWWKWALSAPDRRSPVADVTGEHAGWKQPKDLWFLAGTYGGRVERRCDVPTDRPLFFPVLNIQHTHLYSRVPLTLPVARADAYLNGAPLPLREFTAPPFWATLVRRSAWGIWAGIAPLAPGQYVLEIKADTGDGFWVDTTYHLRATNL
ncbi:hypothetical protein [Streptomyces sp. NPDC059743]|uniref:hypothetical protein n=1 Tax=Streptomyces sp. NPDC059743 TaxID=3346928 RepID=UPI003666B3A1